MVRKGEKEKKRYTDKAIKSGMDDVNNDKKG